MRPIYFRGKHADTNQWVYGGIYQESDNDGNTTAVYIICGADGYVGKAVPVLPETVGQFSGFCDKRGVQIFEGDVIKKRLDNHEYVNMLVAFDGGQFCAKVIPRYKNQRPRYTLDTWCIEVIGNIFDSPDLPIWNQKEEDEKIKKQQPKKKKRKQNKSYIFLR